jgi:hypothetical protein
MEREFNYTLDGMKKKQINFTEEQWAIFEKGFEEGYAVAKRIYKPQFAWTVIQNISGETISVNHQIKSGKLV